MKGLSIFARDQNQGGPSSAPVVCIGPPWVIIEMQIPRPHFRARNINLEGEDLGSVGSYTGISEVSALLLVWCGVVAVGGVIIAFYFDY